MLLINSNLKEGAIFDFIFLICNKNHFLQKQFPRSISPKVKKPNGLYNVLALFDNKLFLSGNVQGFCVFCFDLSNPKLPIELKQYKRGQGGTVLCLFTLKCSKLV